MAGIEYGSAWGKPVEREKIIRLLEAAMGLGSVWIGGFNEDALHSILDIPADVRPVGVVYFGYPAEQKEPRTKYLEEAVFWQKYDPERKHPPRPGNLLA